MELIDAVTLLSELGCLDNRLSLSVIIAAMVIDLGILIATTFPKGDGANINE